jgi:hypothetical protein
MCDRYRDGKCISRYCHYLSAGGTCLNPKMKPKPTNADRIRGMADEDLARNNVRKRKGYVTWTTSDGREFSSYLFGCTYRPDEETIALAIQHELNWLRQPCGGVEND